MNIRICTPVTGESLEKFLNNLKKIQEISDFVELRVDHIQNIKVDDLEKIKNATKAQAIFTCRSKGEGGKFIQEEKSRIEILQKAFDLGFDYVDVELSTMKAHEFKRNTKTKLIISYHNFVETPSYWDVQSIINTMNEFKPDIIKIATMMKEEYESVKIYRLLTNKPHEEERIVIGMGEKGKMTRIIGPILGSYLTYASTEFGETAEGQIELVMLRDIYAIMLKG